jgi:hypothetical protein
MPKRLELAVRYIGMDQPLPRRVPRGRVLMHNQIRHGPQWPTGINGFRAWWAAKPHEGFVPCPCGWAGLPHYAAADYVEGWLADPAGELRWAEEEERRWGGFDGL